MFKIYNYSSLEGFSNEYNWVKLSNCRCKALKNYKYKKYMISMRTSKCNSYVMDSIVLSPDELKTLKDEYKDKVYKVYYRNKKKKENISKGTWIGDKVDIKNFFEINKNYEWMLENGFKLYFRKTQLTK
jgi:hypothetical protein